MKFLLPAAAALMLAFGVQAQTRMATMLTAPVPSPAMTGVSPDPETLRDPASIDAIKAAERKAARKARKAQDDVTSVPDGMKNTPKTEVSKALSPTHPKSEDEEAMTQAQRRAASRAERQAADNAEQGKKAATSSEPPVNRKTAREQAKAEAARIHEERRQAWIVKRDAAAAKAAAGGDTPSRAAAAVPAARSMVNDGSRP